MKVLNFFKSIGKAIGSFFKGVVREAKRVRWPSKKDIVEDSGIVLVFSGFFALFFGITSIIAHAILSALNYFA